MIDQMDLNFATFLIMLMMGTLEYVTLKELEKIEKLLKSK
jgi:hypothetical protein